MTLAEASAPPLDRRTVLIAAVAGAFAAGTAVWIVFGPVGSQPAANDNTLVSGSPLFADPGCEPIPNLENKTLAELLNDLRKVRMAKAAAMIEFDRLADIEFDQKNNGTWDDQDEELAKIRRASCKENDILAELKRRGHDPSSFGF